MMMTEIVYIECAIHKQIDSTMNAMLLQNEKVMILKEHKD